jgi:hypothetical protein
MFPSVRNAAEAARPTAMPDLPRRKEQRNNGQNMLLRTATGEIGYLDRDGLLEKNAAGELELDDTVNAADRRVPVSATWLPT